MTLYINTRYVSMHLWPSGRQCGFWSILVTVEVCRKSQQAHRAALRWTDLILYVSVAVCRPVEAYSNCRQIRVLYASDFSSCLCGLIFLLRKPNDWFAFFVMLAMCVPQLRSSKIVIPRYLAVDILSSSLL